MKHHSKLEGIISISSKGTGYVKVPTPVGIPTEVGQDIEIDFKHLNTALHGDVVEIALHAKTRGRQTGEVKQIINRAKMSFAGILEEEHHTLFLKPDDTKM